MGKLAMIEQRDSRDRLRQRIKGLLGLGQLPEQQLLAVLPDVPWWELAAAQARDQARRWRMWRVWHWRPPRKSSGRFDDGALT